MAESENKDKEKSDDSNEVAHRTKTYAVVDPSQEHEKFGGSHFGAMFFGWLTANGMAVLLTALLSALGVSLAITTNLQPESVGAGDTETIGWIGAALLLLVLATAYYAGGYVAGRMSRFDGGRQGFGVWLIGIVVILLLGGLGALLGTQFNILQNLNLPSLPIPDQTYTTTGLVTLLAILLITLIAAVIGGKQGEAYHKKVNKAGYSGTVEQ